MHSAYDEAAVASPPWRSLIRRKHTHQLPVDVNPVDVNQHHPEPIHPFGPVPLIPSLNCRDASKSWKRDAALLASWSTGTTGYPFVDANMRELLLTGFMSNRGRQNVASFLVGADCSRALLCRGFITCCLDAASDGLVLHHLLARDPSWWMHLPVDDHRSPAITPTGIGNHVCR